MSALAGDEARRRFTAARVASLATVDATGAPHLVPVVFVVAGSTIRTAVDGKPKRATLLRRHANIAGQPRVSLLAQHWDEDWSLLWWVRADGLASVLADPASVRRAATELTAKYPQYSTVGVHGPVIEVRVQTWRGWSAR